MLAGDAGVPFAGMVSGATTVNSGNGVVGIPAASDVR